MCLLASWIARYHLNDQSMWRKIIDHKYKTDAPNLFCCPDKGVSPFWKGVLWAMQAAQMGYAWNVGDGNKVRFWKDRWFGNSSLAIQFWHVYVIVNEKGKTIKYAWDGSVLKFSFRRTFPPALMDVWWEVFSIAESIVFTDESDTLVWSFNSNDIYSVQSLYAVVNFRGVKPVYPSAIWGLYIPPRVQVFLWLLSNNKLLTRDNLSKRREVFDKTCLLCSDDESIGHIFFYCCAVLPVWSFFSELFDTQLTGGFECVAKWWISRNNHAVLNMCTSATL